MLWALLALATAVDAAQTVPQSMAPQFRANPTDAADLETQTRVYAESDRQAVLLAAAAALQDMGYSITLSEPTFGLLVGRKRAPVESAGIGHAVAEAGLVATTLLLSLMTGQDLVQDLPEQTEQVVHVSLLVSEAISRPGTEVRISLDREMFYDQGYSLPDHTELPAVYEEFFDRLSRAVFLEEVRL